jgi:hypothetical protein
MYDDFPTMSYEEKLLQAVKLAVVQRLNKQMLHGLQDIEVATMADFMADQIVAKFSATVWSDPSQSHTETVTIKQPGVHPSWRHAKMASYPLDSFRRRFFSRFYNIDEDYQTATIEHTLTVHVPAVLPENQRQFPPEMGRIMFPISIDRGSYVE